MRYRNPLVAACNHLHVSLCRPRQGCNSRVFRVKLRRRSRGKFSAKPCDDVRGGAPVQEPHGQFTSSSNNDDGGNNDTGTAPARRGASGFVNELLDFGGQLLEGRFGACFSGNNVFPVEGEEEHGAASRQAEVEVGSGRDGGRRNREFALKMALTYRGQDPAQVRVCVFCFVFRLSCRFSATVPIKCYDNSSEGYLPRAYRTSVYYSRW